MVSSKLEILISQICEDRARGNIGKERLLLDQVRSEISPQDTATFLPFFKHLIHPNLNFGSMRSLQGLIKTLYPGNDNPIKIAVLGSSNLHEIVGLIKVFLFGQGIESEFYEAPYDGWQTELLDKNSVLHQFKPKVILLLTDHRNAVRNLEFPSSDSALEQRAEEVLDGFKHAWKIMDEDLKAICIQNNFDPVPFDPLNNLSFSQSYSLNGFTNLLNHQLVRSKPDHVYFHDLGALVSRTGFDQWYDWRMYHFAKHPCSHEAFVRYAYSLARLIGAIYGKSKKCLVLDLDNTLWGGIIGDDGMEGIILGAGSAKGEAFQDFQKYILSLQKIGVLLAVNSKNNPEIAEEPFKKHPEMLIQREHITCFLANWNDKASNIKEIARQLNIGTDALVFLDDTPFEREQVLRMVPEVAVPALPEDPSDYIKIINQFQFFEPASLTQEDLSKTEDYKARIKRIQFLKSTKGSINDHLQRLNIQGEVTLFQKIDLDRICQLINKTNQFNLTSRRYSKSEILKVMQNANYLGLSARVQDKFGNYGLISAMIAKHTGHVLDILSWVMSCRVFGKGIEQFLFNHLAREAIKRGVQEIRGTFTPTQKNEVVKNLYPSLGMEEIPNLTVGKKRTFTCSVNTERQPLPTFVKEKM